MTQPPDPLEVQRLAFIRYLYEQGVSHADQPEPLSATAMLAFHDATELFLHLAGEHLGANLPSGINFGEYWEKLKQVTPGKVPLPSKNAMERMNKARVAFKHHGTIPSTTAIQQAKGDVTTFLTDATQLVFGLVFTDIDLIDMVPRPETVRNLRIAQTHADKADYPAALAGLAIAFDELIEHYSQHHEWWGVKNMFGFGPTIFPYQTRAIRDSIEKRVKELSESAAAMQRALRLIALGIDYRRYAQFELLVPKIMRTISNHMSYYVSAAQKLSNDQDYQNCKRFVIEASLQAAQADAFLAATAKHGEINRPESAGPAASEHRDWAGPA